MKTVHILSALLLAVCAAGCAQITSTQLIGEPLSPEETNAFEGPWTLNDSRADALSAARGEIQLEQITSPEINEKQATVFVTKLDNDLFIHVQEPAELNPSYYFAHLVKNSSDSYKVCLPRFNVFKDAAVLKDLQGEVSDVSDKVHLSGTSEQLNNFIREKGVAALFGTETPLLLKKEN